MALNATTAAAAFVASISLPGIATASPAAEPPDPALAGIRCAWKPSVRSKCL